MSEHTLIRESERGAKARTVLENEILLEAWQKVEEGILDKWKECPIRDTEGQQALKIMHKLLGEVRRYVEEVAETGRLAQITLEHQRTILQKAKDALVGR